MTCLAIVACMQYNDKVSFEEIREMVLAGKLSLFLCRNRDQRTMAGVDLSRETRFFGDPPLVVTRGWQIRLYVAGEISTFEAATVDECLSELRRYLESDFGTLAVDLLMARVHGRA